MNRGPVFTPERVARLRVASQFPPMLSASTPAEVVRALGAVQAQDYYGAQWAIGQRIPGSTDEVLEQAVTDGAILRTHILRPTWHFVTPADIRWLLALTSPRVRQACAYMFRKTELDARVFRRSEAVFEKELRGGRHRTRTELGAALQRAKIDISAEQRLAYLVMSAELNGVICSGPRRGVQSTYALLDERATPSRDFRPGEPLLELTRRYFAHRGPATPQDISWWSGLTVADAKRGIAMMGSELESVSVDGRRHWFVAGLTIPRGRARQTHLLPNYDESFIGFKDRGAFGVRARAASPKDRKNASLAHIVEIDGQLVGGWKRAVSKGTLQITLNTVVPLSPADAQAIARAAKSHAAYLRLPLDLRSL